MIRSNMMLSGMQFAEDWPPVKKMISGACPAFNGETNFSPGPNHQCEAAEPGAQPESTELTSRAKPAVENPTMVATEGDVDEIATPGAGRDTSLTFTRTLTHFPPPHVAPGATIN